MRAVDHVDPGRALGDPGALHLGQAAAHRDLHALLLLRQQVPQVAVQPVGRVLPDRAGVEHHHVRGLAVAGGLVARLVEQARQALGIVRVHLAPVGADLVGAAACCHTTRIGAGARDSAAQRRSDRDAIDCTGHKSGSRVPGDLCGRIRHDICMRMTTETASYGEWPSPIDGADVARTQVGLSFPVIDAAGVWWQESRPEEGGRVTVVRQGPDGVKRDLLPDAVERQDPGARVRREVVPAAAGRVRLR